MHVAISKNTDARNILYICAETLQDQAIIKQNWREKKNVAQWSPYGTQNQGWHKSNHSETEARFRKKIIFINHQMSLVAIRIKPGEMTIWVKPKKNRVSSLENFLLLLLYDRQTIPYGITVGGEGGGWPLPLNHWDCLKRQSRGLNF